MKIISYYRTIILVLALFVSLAGQDVITLVVEGSGVSRDAAIQDAKRVAVEKGIGQIIASETIVKNYSLFSDQIISRSNGFVKSYKILTERKESDQSWTVKIEADVTKILDEVLQDQLAIDLLLQWVKKPRFMVLIDESIEGQSNSHVTEVEIGRIMAEKNFNIVSREQTGKTDRELDTGNETGVLQLATNYNVDILVLGTAHAEATDMGNIGYGNLGDTGMKSGQASISAKVIRIETSEILAQNTFTGASPHINPVIAGTNALKKASKKLANYLIRETIRTWSQEQANYQTFRVMVSGVNYSTAKNVEYFLETLDGVLKVRRERFANGKAEFQVDYQKGDIDNLAMQLDGYEGEGFRLQVIGATNYSLNLKLDTQ